MFPLFHTDFLLFIIFLHHSIFQNVVGNLYNREKGKKMTGQALETHNLVPVTWCALLCSDHKGCWSFNYMSQNNMCELNGRLKDPVIIDDTNSDLHSPEWVDLSGSSYKFVIDQKRTWNAANTFCQSIGAHLIRIETEEEYGRIIDVLAGNFDSTQEQFYIDLRKITHDFPGTWQWGDGTALFSDKWDAGRPHDITKYRAFIFKPNQLLRDASGLHQYYAICEK